MDIPKKCDVVVIGGGPGGSSAATRLSQKGYDVVLFDKVKHPRYMVGESLIPHFWKYCEEIGVDKKIDDEGFIQKAGGTVVWNDVIRQMQFKDFGYQRPALHVERDRFDHILLEHAKESGAQVFEEVAVVKANLPQNGELASVDYRINGDKSVEQISCKFIIDSSGQNALIAKQLGTRVMDDGFRFMSIWGYFDDSKYIAADGKAHEFSEIREVPPTTFVSNIDGWGWMWHIPQREHTSVGLILPKEQMKAIKDSDEDLEKYFQRKCYEIPYLDRLLENASYCEDNFHIIRNYSYRPQVLAGPGYYLVGDAAAFIDPIFSIGIVVTMFSSGLACWAIDRSLKNPKLTDSSREYYTSKLQKRLQVSRALALPSYGYGEEEAEQVRTSIKVETSLELELMHVVSTMTTRSENFVKMIGEEGAKQISSEKYRVLNEIEF